MSEVMTLLTSVSGHSIVKSFSGTDETVKSDLNRLMVQVDDT